MIRPVAHLLFCLAVAAGAGAGEASANDLIRIGGDVDVSDATGGSLTAFGGRVAVDAPVAGDLRAAGGQIEVGSGAAIEGSASLAGGHITVQGPIHGNLRAAGGQITIDGPVTGDASIAGGTLSLGPDARIAGKLVFRGGELHQSPAAQVAGGVEHVRRGHHYESTPMNRFTRGWAWTAALLVLAALIAGALPGPSQRLALELRERPWLTALLGFLALSAIPLAAILLMVTIIGIPIGILALVLYGVLLLVGYVWLAVVLGGLILDRFHAETAALTAWRVGAAMLAMLVMAILGRMPYVGGALKLAALAVGMGMIVGAVMRHTQAPAETITPA